MGKISTFGSLRFDGAKNLFKAQYFVPLTGAENSYFWYLSNITRGNHHYLSIAYSSLKVVVQNHQVKWHTQSLPLPHTFTVKKMIAFVALFFETVLMCLLFEKSLGN